MTYTNLIKEMINECLVFDIETSSHKNGVPINIKKDFKNYVENAIVKWVGCYSYKHNQYYNFNAITQHEEIVELFNEHSTYIGLNSEAFDTPVMKNNGFIDKKWFKQIDVQVILGKDGFKFHKNRASYMGVNLKTVYINDKKYGPNSLMSLAHHFKLPILKGDIDYEIFHKNSWDESETKDIIKYLEADVKVTKLLFDKLVEFWTIFTPWLYESDVKKWVWLRSSIASLTYCAACKVKNVEPSYGTASEDKEDMGGRAIEPPQEESFNIHYLDEASKYPHTFAEFCLCSEVNVRTWTQTEIDREIELGNLWHGNDMFKVKGYYDISKQGTLEKDIINKLTTRFAIKKILKNIKDNKIMIPIPEELKGLLHNNVVNDSILATLNGLQYAIKIFLNSLYGAIRSPIFEQINSEWAGYDCCWIGQQIHEYVEDFFAKKNYKIVGGFTDSWFFESIEGDSKESMEKLAEQVMNEIYDFMPYPAKSHTIEYETHLDYLLYNYDKSAGRYKKNNYAYVDGDKVKIVGFPIKKNNATRLSIKIFNEYLKPQGIKNKRLKFSKDYLQELITKELTNDLTLVAVNVKCNPFETYKNLGQLQAQVSKNYLDGLDGSVTLIKNTKYGKVGKGAKYCTVEEALERNFKIDDLVLTKVWNELQPFIEAEKVVDLFSFASEGDSEDLFGDEKKWF